MTKIASYYPIVPAQMVCNNFLSSEITLFEPSKIIGNYVITKVDSGVCAFNELESSCSLSSESMLNTKRLNELEKKFTQQLIGYILEDNFEYGMESKAQILVKKQLKINPSVTKNWINKIYVNSINNAEILIGILRIIARFDRNDIFPIGDTIAMASLSHNNEMVQETAIRAFESWGGEESISILANANVASKWINEYLEEVMADLKREYAD